MLQDLVVGAGNFEPWGSGSSLGWVITCLSPPRGKMKWVPPKCQGNLTNCRGMTYNRLSVWSVFLWVIIVSKRFFFSPDGCYDYFGFGFTTLFLRKVLYIANWYLSTGYSDPCYEEIVQQNTSFTCKGNVYFADVLSQEDMSVVVPRQRATSFELVPREGNSNHVEDQLQKFDESYIPSIERPLARRYSFGKEKQKLPHDDKSSCRS